MLRIRVPNNAPGVAASPAVSKLRLACFRAADDARHTPTPQVDLHLGQPLLADIFRGRFHTLTVHYAKVAGLHGKSRTCGVDGGCVERTLRYTDIFRHPLPTAGVAEYLASDSRHEAVWPAAWLAEHSASTVLLPD
jgi:hypothetical protein